MLISPYWKDCYSQIFFCVGVIEGYWLIAYRLISGTVNKGFSKTEQIYLRAYEKQFRKMLVLISVYLSVLYIPFFSSFTCLEQIFYLDKPHIPVQNRTRIFFFLFSLLPCIWKKTLYSKIYVVLLINLLEVQ